MEVRVSNEKFDSSTIREGLTLEQLTGLFMTFHLQSCEYGQDWDGTWMVAAVVSSSH